MTGSVGAAAPPPSRMSPPRTPAVAHQSTSTKASLCTWSYIKSKARSILGCLFFREFPLLQRYSPRFFQPDFTWPHRIFDTKTCSHHLPACPKLPESRWRTFIGRFHAALPWFSKLYCTWYGFPYSHVIVPLPFGLVLKWADGTTLDEARSMMAIRAAGFPCAKVVSVGSHPSPNDSHRPASILMTRIPGEMLDEMDSELSETDRAVIDDEIQRMLDTMRAWKSPWGQRICSISGGSIRSIRVPRHRVGPCESETEFTKYLLSASSSHSFHCVDEFQAAIKVAEKLDENPHRIVFTHGDLALHNIMVHEGRVSGFIDCECAGWYPEYREFTTPLRWPTMDLQAGAWFRKMGVNDTKAS